jgi:cytochrome P450
VAAAAEVPELGFDPFSREFLENPFPDHARLRDAGPVAWLQRYGVYAVGRHAEVRAVLQDWKTFSSAAGVGLADFRREKPWRLPSLVLETDPPQHGRARRVLSASAVTALRTRFQQDADEMVAALVARGTFDAVPDLAEAYPLQVFPDAVGMPRENRRHLLPYGNMLFNSFGPHNALFADGVQDAAPVLEWVQAQSRRENLAATGFGAEIHAAADAGELTHEEAPMVVRSLLSAGVDTTVSGLGAALYCLATHLGQFQALRADPSLARAAFEEAVRFESPVQTFFRTTTRPAELGGATLEEGRKVLVFMAAANRDPRRWERPDDYDIRRPVAGHVGWGVGIHACIGMLVARLEGECVLTALAQQASAIEPAGPPVRRCNNTLRGLASLPLRLTAA